MTNKEKFLALVSKEETQTIERAKTRLAKKSYTKLSNLIAFEILERLDEYGWSQRKLAEKMNVSPQQVNKWVKGNENFTLATLARLGEVLETELIKVPNRSEVKIKPTVKLPNSTFEYKTPEITPQITPIIRMRAVI
ncbi:MAG: helix-turn-helix transcriptional regulator [Dysgonamonadaceae bacterium]|nr:helix-turn-helix transcriptional regulator [Dysgonamonadaceae bacterium]MDD4728180.1 helix-turn-helix transcriptional regulator [Dysgonamonadaceae bacterium]